MKKTILFLVSILFIATTFTSCGEDEKECPIDEPTNTELLTQAEWIGKEIVIYVNDVEIERDDNISSYSMVFLPNFDVLYYNEGEPNNVGLWRFVNDEQSIEIDEETWNIDTLSQSDFIISVTENDGDDVIKRIVSFNH